MAHLDAASLLNSELGAIAGTSLLYLPETTSTQDVARELLDRGARAGTAIIAGSQSSGRGTRGRHWISEPGAGLYASLLVSVPARVEAVQWLTPAIAVAVVQALRGLTTVPPRLKWPNDVLLGDAKVAGVLTEIPGSSHLAIAGIGVNIHAAPVETVSYPVTCLDNWALRKVTREEVAARLFREVDHILAELARGRIDHVKEAWRLLLDTLGRRVVIEVGGTLVKGRARHVDAAGALIVRTDEQRSVRVSSSEAGTVRHDLEEQPTAWPQFGG